VKTKQLSYAIFFEIHIWIVKVHEIVQHFLFKALWILFVVSRVVYHSIEESWLLKL
jgi:hypothetical protein